MRFRHRLLALFGIFAVGPLLAVGALGAARSLRSLESLVDAEVTEHAERIARSLRDRADHLESDAALLSGNEETQRLLEAFATGDSADMALRLASAGRYIDELWTVMRHGYERIAIAGPDRRVLLTRQDSLGGDLPMRDGALTPIVRSITGASGARSLGTLHLHPHLRDLVPLAELQEGFGERRLNAVLDRSAGWRVVARGGRLEEEPRLPDSLKEAMSLASHGSVPFDDAGERRIAAFVHLETLPLTVVATASVAEFAAPFVRQRLVDLLLLVLVVVAVSLGFFVLLGRAVRPLDQLAAAAARVGDGDLAPELPPVSADEIGRLTSAFGDMAVRLREMLSQVEASRQTAVLGHFALELAHEIRNPLTSVKLNLQGLEREARTGGISEGSRVAIAMSLREVNRIDHALRTALRVGRPPAAARPYDVRTTLEEAMTLLHPEADAHGVQLECRWVGEVTEACGDPESIRGVFVNLLLNAIQAMSASRHPGRGGVVHIGAGETLLRGDVPAIEIRIRDEGPGIPVEQRDRIFHPFFTTREQGTGLGLSVALQTMRTVGGTLRLGEGGGPGAEFVVTLPLALAEAANA